MAAYLSDYCNTSTCRRPYDRRVSHSCSLLVKPLLVDVFIKVFLFDLFVMFGAGGDSAVSFHTTETTCSYYPRCRETPLLHSSCLTCSKNPTARDLRRVASAPTNPSRHIESFITSACGFNIHETYVIRIASYPCKYYHLLFASLADDSYCKRVSMIRTWLWVRGEGGGIFTYAWIHKLTGVTKFTILGD